MTTPGLKEAYFDTWSEPLTSLDSSYRVMQPNEIKINLQELQEKQDLCEFKSCKAVGWIQEQCGHGSKRWIKISCERWDCEQCSKFKFNKELSRIRKAVKYSAIHLGGPLKFLTLTFTEDVDQKTARRKLQIFAKKIRRKWGMFEYAKAPEYTKNGRLHLHLLVIMPFIPQKWLQESWGAIVDIRSVQCKPCYKKKAEICRHHQQAGFEGAEELLKYMSKAKAGKLTHSRGFPKADEFKSQSGVCTDCGKEHKFTYQKDHREQMAEFANNHKLNFLSGVKFAEWIGSEVPIYQNGKKCNCWIVNNGEGL